MAADGTHDLVAHAGRWLADAVGTSHELPPRETSASQQRRVAGCRCRLIRVVGLEGLETRPANPRDSDALEHRQLRSGAARAAVEEQPHVDGLSIRIDSELARTPEAAREATALTAPHELTILGSHGGALALVAVPEKAPLPGAGRRSPLAAGHRPSRPAAVRSSARRGRLEAEVVLRPRGRRRSGRQVPGVRRPGPQTAQLD